MNENVNMYGTLSRRLISPVHIEQRLVSGKADETSLKNSRDNLEAGCLCGLKDSGTEKSLFWNYNYYYFYDDHPQR